MEAWQLFVSFVENQGAVTAIVFALLYYMHQGAKKNAVIMQGMIDNQASESRQQDDILNIMKATIAKQAESDQRIGDNTAATTKQTESINTMQNKFNSLEKAIHEAIRKMENLPAKTELAPETRAALVDDITNGLKSTMQECLTAAIKSTQETPAIVAVEEIKHLQATETEEQTNKVKTIKTEEEKPE